MPNLTPKHKFNTFLENEPVDFEQVNENFEKLDDFNMCIESGTKTATRTIGGTSGTIVWDFSKYTDKTIRMTTTLDLNGVQCNNGASMPFASQNIQAYFPFSFTKIKKVNMHMVSETIGWISDITGRDTTDSVLFKILSATSESSPVFKRVYVEVEGVVN